MSVRPAVTFDLWHTLLYLAPEAEAEYLSRQTAAAVRVLEDSPRVDGAPALSEAGIRAVFEEELRSAVAASHEGRTVTPGEQISRAARALGREPRPEAYEVALGQIVGGVRFRTAPSAREALAEIRNAGFALGIVSNTVGEPGRYFRAVLRDLGFDASVEVYTFSDEHPWTKPSPEIFRITLDALGSQPARAVHVGDGWADLEGARRAGLRGAVHFVGLQEYAPQYRALNYAPAIDPALVHEQISDLRRVLPIAQQLLNGAS